MYKLLQSGQKKDFIFKQETDLKDPAQKTIWFKNGFLYKGQVKNDFLNGNGILLLGEGSFLKGKLKFLLFKSKEFLKKIYLWKEFGDISQV